jgi:hypothetical protein
MRHFPLIVSALLLAGCTSTATHPPSLFASDPWNEVTAIEHGATVVIHIQCHGSADDACVPEGAEATRDGYRLEGELAEASAASILLDPSLSGMVLLPVRRADVARVFIEVERRRWLAPLIGAAIGTTICAVSGLYGESDLVGSFKVLMTGVCTGGGAGVGYLAKRDPTTLRLVYERVDLRGQRRSPGER